jgi:DNA-binding GntR family transcriptional regulator
MQHFEAPMVIERSTYKNHVINYIYDGIRENRFLPGEKILESHLSKDLGISRAPVREALADLVSAGVLDYRPQVGNFIASPSPEEIIESYVTRGVLEGFAVAQGRESFDKEELNRLEAMTHQMEVYARKRQHKNLINLGQRFHEMLFRHCKNRQVVTLTEQLSLKLHLFFYKHWAQVYTPEEIRDRHLQIVTALRNKDPMKIELLIRNHYIDTGHKIAELEQSAS